MQPMEKIGGYDFPPLPRFWVFYHTAGKMQR